MKFVVKLLSLQERKNQITLFDLFLVLFPNLKKKKKKKKKTNRGEIAHGGRGIG